MKNKILVLYPAARLAMLTVELLDIKPGGRRRKRGQGKALAGADNFVMTGGA